VVSVTPRPRFTPGKGPQLPIVQEAGWASELVWTQKLEEKSFASPGSNPGRPACSQTPCWLELPQFLSFGIVLRKLKLEENFREINVS
jgi:hypothetical protein